MVINLGNFFNIKNKNSKISDFQDLDHLDGVAISVVNAKLYNPPRDDLVLFYFRNGANFASVYTQSTIVSENIRINVFFLVSIILIPISYFLSKSLILVAIATGLMFFLTGFIFPLAMGKGISLFRHISGTATAVMYLINILMTSLSAFIAGFIEITSAIELVWIYAALLLLAVIIYWSMIHGKEG